ncbi:MAG TPA: M56 family metallopeptidase, partial [Longimicrobiales bacterium]|nr:M56 family metallopeptidase [Longimicrobiales bacterium]
MIRTIGWAIVHSVWQAGVIAVLTAAILFMLRKSSAATRYWVAVVGLMAITATPILTVATLRAPATISTSASGSATVRGNDTRFAPSGNVAQSDEAMRTGADRLNAPSIAIKRPTRIEAFFPWIVALWLLGVILFSIRTAAGLVWARKLTRTGTTAVSDQLRGVAARIADNMGVRVAVRVLESSRVTVPMLVGWLRPVILMPASVLIGLTPQQIEAILAHELAHVKRNDYAVNLLQTVVEILYFYHPAAWWLSGRIREERENACDELAVSACGGDRIFYSRVLLTVEESRGEVPALAVAATGGSLSRRIHRLLGAQQAHLDIGPRWYAGVFTIGLAVVGAGGLVDEGFPHTTPDHRTIAVAQDRNTKPDTVIKFTGGGTLEQRWAWAEQTAKKNNYDRYWIGYLIQGDPNGDGWYHFDRTTPVSLGDNMTTMGHMRLGGNFSDVRISGTPMQKVIGEREPHNIVVFMAYDHGKLSRVHLSSFVFPMNFNKLPVLWLEQVQDRESIEKLIAVEATTSNGDLQEDLIASVGAHTDAIAAVPVLERYATDMKRSNDVRREAVESLGRFQSQGVLSLLARLARSDREEDIRAEAVETIGNLNVAGASDTLMAFARTLTGERERSESFEALADVQGDDSERLKMLVDVVNHDRDPDIQGRAAEAIGNLRNH